MSPLWLGILLLMAVAAVSIATRPAPRRRRPAPGVRHDQDAESEPLGTPAGTQPGRPRSPDIAHRNHWDRHDLMLGAGRDFALPDLRLVLWPESRPAARSCEVTG
jgi:hypothetical protein